MSDEERKILEILDAAIEPQHVRALIDSKVRLAEQKLAGDPAAQMTWEILPLGSFGHTVPSAIRSAWIFVLRAGATTGAERHPNSHQRTMSYRGTGAFEVRAGDKWSSNPLVSDPEAALDKRWFSIPPNTWHEVAVPPGKGHWVVVSFHTVPADELIEERPDAGDEKLTRQRTYVSSQT